MIGRLPEWIRSDRMERGSAEEPGGAGSSGWRDALTADSRFALRQFRRRWGTTAAMLAILSLGMSISILLFSFVHSFAVQPPPMVPRADDLVRIRGSRADDYGGRAPRTFSFDELAEYRRMDRQFSAVAGWANATVNLDVGDDQELTAIPAEATLVTASYFTVLGVRPILGAGLPTFESEDPAAARVAVIGHAAWDQLFGRSPDVIGRTLQVNGVPVTIVGVAPPRFVGVGGGSRLQLWLPLSNRHILLSSSSAETLAFRAAARLRPGVETGPATAAVRVVAAQAAAAAARPRAEEVRDPGADVVPLLAANGDPYFDQDLKSLVLSLGLLGLLVLLVTCTNVSALLTGLAMSRRQEVAVRLSLGAPRARIVRQLLTESALLAVMAGVVALGLVWIVLHAVNTAFPLLPVAMGITWPAAVFTFSVAMAVGLLFGLAPALHATRAGIGSAMRDSGAGIAGTRLRLQRVLVVAQIAFTQPLVVGVVAVLVIVMNQYRPASRNEFADRLVSLRLWSATRPLDPGSAGSGSLQAEIRRVRARLEATPGVAAAVFGSEPTGELGSYVVDPGSRVAGGRREAFRVSGSTASPGFFSVMGIRLLRGREFSATDARYVRGSAAEVPVVIGGDLARRLWPGADPLGKRLRAAQDSVIGPVTLVVTGVAADPDADRRDPREGHRIYLAPDTAVAPAALLVRTTSDAQPLLPTVRRVVQEEAPSMIANVQTVAAIEDESRKNFRMVTGGLAGSAFLALLLSAIGLYAVMAFAVGQRAREIAVRMAVGAPARRIAGSFVADGLRLSVIGLVLGLPISLIGLQAVNSMPEAGIPHVALAPVIVLGVLGVLAVAAAATLVPARRAASMDPARVLRQS